PAQSGIQLFTAIFFHNSPGLLAPGNNILAGKIIALALIANLDDTATFGKHLVAVSRFVAKTFQFALLLRFFRGLLLLRQLLTPHTFGVGCGFSLLPLQAGGVVGIWR